MLDRGNFYLISLSTLITYLLDNVWILKWKVTSYHFSEFKGKRSNLLWHTGVIQEQDIHSNVQNLNDFPKKLIRAVSGVSRLLAWDHFRWFVDLLIDILPVSFQVGAILWCLNFFFCCCCCFFVQNYLRTEWNHLLLACSRNHSTFPSTIVRLCESSTRERAWRGSKNNTFCVP